MKYPSHTLRILSLLACLWALSGCTDNNQGKEVSPQTTATEVNETVDSGGADAAPSSDPVAQETEQERKPERPVMTVEQPVLLKDVQGREIRAEVLSVVSDSVSVVRVDTKQRFAIPLNTLSEETQTILERFQSEQRAIAEWEAAYSTAQAVASTVVATPSATLNTVDPQSDVAGYWYAKVPDFRANAQRILSTPLRRASAPVAVATKDGSLSLTIAPDGGAVLKRDGQTVSNANAQPWTVVDWTKGYISTGEVAKDVLRYPLSNMQAIGQDELLLWSDDGRFRIIVKITGKSRHLNFELIHASDDPRTGLLSNNWQGHRVEFDLGTQAQSDGWKLNTLLLNPMSELNTRSKHREDNRSYFAWPYPYWAQTDDRPQPQGMVAVHGFIGPEGFDDAMIDVWVEEPSLPRPHRAIHSVWDRPAVEAWLNRVVAFHEIPRKIFSFSPAGDPESLYKIAELAAKHDVNAIALHNWDWQGLTIGEPNPQNFPNGLSDVEKVQKFYADRGIDFKLHGFGAIFMTRDTKYGEPKLEENLAKRGLSIAARGTVVEDVPANEGTILLQPDLSLYPWLKPWMLPRSSPPWGRSNSGYGNTFPPYFEGNHTTLALQGRARTYEVELTEDRLWRVTLGSWRGANKHTDLKKGEVLNFIVNGAPSWMTPDPCSEMYVQMADEYSHILNKFQSRPVYDGAGWSEAYGTWSLRKMVQMVYERIDHPVTGHEHFGFTDQMFKRVKKAVGSRPRSVSLGMESLASLTSSIDDAHFSLSAEVQAKDMGVRGNHKGISLDYAQKHGHWSEVLDALRIWQDLKPYLSEAQKGQIAKRYEKLRNTHRYFYFATEADDAWYLTPKRAIHREGIDGTWKLIPERPRISTRQYCKADGTAIEGLENPYATQTPAIELHAMATMSSGSQANLPLMPKSKDAILQSGKGRNLLEYRNGALTVTYDNSGGNSEAVIKWKPNKEEIPYWYAEPIHGKQFLDFSQQRGISITVEGDGSGAVLLFSYGPSFPRSFAIDIDFVGKRTFEFPNGEMINNRFDWDAYSGQTITAFKYNRVDRFQLYFNRVPAGKKVKVTVSDIRTMAEDKDTGLVQPVLNLNGALAKVEGTIPYNHYLTYQGGETARVYDSTWHLIKELPVSTNGDLAAVNGDNTFSVSAPQSPNAWLSVRVTVLDEDNSIRIPKP